MIRWQLPICKRCGMATERSFVRDAYYCQNPVCGRGVTGMSVANTPRWLHRFRWFGMW